MKAALLAKAKAAGPLRTPLQELDHLIPWWPPRLQFTALELSKRLHGYWQVEGAEQRHMLEREIIAWLRLRLIERQKKDTSTQFLLEFLERVETAVEQSMQLRRQAIAGVFVPADAEEHCVEKLEEWLRHQAWRPESVGVADAAYRLLAAWKRDRWLR